MAQLVEVLELRCATAPPFRAWSVLWLPPLNFTYASSIPPVHNSLSNIHIRTRPFIARELDLNFLEKLKMCRYMAAYGLHCKTLCQWKWKSRTNHTVDTACLEAFHDT